MADYDAELEFQYNRKWYFAFVNHNFSDESCAVCGERSEKGEVPSVSTREIIEILDENGVGVSKRSKSYRHFKLQMKPLCIACELESFPLDQE
jgi:hypothetical protein